MINLNNLPKKGIEYYTIKLDTNKHSAKMVYDVFRKINDKISLDQTEDIYDNYVKNAEEGYVTMSISTSLSSPRVYYTTNETLYNSKVGSVINNHILVADMSKIHLNNRIMKYL